MGFWTELSPGSFLHTGTTRDVFVLTRTFPRAGAIRFQFGGPEQNPLAYFLGDALGLNGWEAGLDATGTGGNAIIRKVINGTPQSAAASAAHGLSDFTPGSIEVRLADRVVEVRLGGSTTAVVTYTIPADDSFLAFQRCGLSSAAGAAQVSNAKVYELEPIVTPRVEALVAICGGDAFLATDTTAMRQIGTAVCKTLGYVSLADYRQKIYGTDGERPFVIDPKTETAGPWLLTAGSHLGQTSTNPQSTSNPPKARFTFVSTYQDRLVQGGDPQDPQNLLFLRVGDAADADSGANRAGKAWFLSGQGGRVGSPCLGFVQASNGVGVIGCQDSVWRIVGDPALGRVDITPINLPNGISGPESMTLAADGQLIAHSPEGAWVLSISGEAYSFSRDVLTQFIQFPRSRAADFLVQVRRDPVRHRVHFFLTAPAGSGTTHLSYNERIGRLVPDGGGFEPIVFGSDLGPTSSCVWNGLVVVGTRTGELLIFDDAAMSDDGAAIDTRVPLALMDDGELWRETIMHRVDVLLADGSGDVTAQVYGGATPTIAYERRASELRFTDTIVAPLKSMRQATRGQALVLVLSQSSGSARFALERVDAVTTLGRMMSPTRVVPPAEQSGGSGQVSGGSSGGEMAQGPGGEG